MNTFTHSLTINIGSSSTNASFDCYVYLDSFCEDFKMNIGVTVKLEVEMILYADSSQYETSDIEIKEVRLIFANDQYVDLTTDDYQYRAIDCDEIKEYILSEASTEITKAWADEIEAQAEDDGDYRYELQKQEFLDEEML
jgi:hypothetical protein